ncbi:MAG: HlyD family type I secretion periplasmic adaptor subunit [Paracoccaceae bacterium]
MKSDGIDLSYLTPRRVPVLIGILAVTLLLAGVGLWATQALIDGAVVASGRVIVERNRQAVQHPDGGVVSEVLIQEGERVDRGEILVRLDPTLLRSELSITENQLYELMSRRGRLSAERDGATHIEFDPALLRVAEADPKVAELVEGQRGLFEARLASFSQSLSQMENQKLQLQNQIAGINAIEGALSTQITLAKDELAVQQGLLDRGLAPMSRVLNLRRETARLSGSTGETVARRAQALERIAEIEIEMTRLLSGRRQDAITTLRDLQVSELEIAERREAILTRLERMDIRAPIAGIAYDVRLLGEQSVLRPADPLLFIVPMDRPLVIECRVRPINVNSVHVAQDVVIRFPSFDMRQTPDLFGKVTQISPDAFADEDTGAAFYRVEVTLSDAELAKLDKSQVVIPGMPVDAYLKTGEYTPFAYLTRPLTRYLDTAMRNGS